ncbi:LysR substrate-binding domain-containing protein [Paracoccus sp. P2]
MRDEVERAQDAVRPDSSDVKDPIRFGCLPSLSSSVIAAAIVAWQHDYPAGRVRVFERVQIDLLEGLLRRDFDFAIGVTTFYNILAGLRQRVLYRERLLVVTRTNHPLTARDGLSLADLTGFPWVVPPAGRHRPLLEDMLTAAGQPIPEQQIVCSSSALLKALVASTDYLALLPSHAIAEEVDAHKLTALPIFAPELDRSVAVLFRDGYQMDNVRNGLVTAIQTAGQSLVDI